MPPERLCREGRSRWLLALLRSSFLDFTNILRINRKFLGVSQWQRPEWEVGPRKRGAG
jgi:hypothetical protein